MYKQIIIARTDLDMSAGKLAAQVSHASMAFLTSKINKTVLKVDNHKFKTWGINRLTGEKEEIHYIRPDLEEWAKEARNKGEEVFYARPIDETDPYRKFELCEPDYYYHTSFKIDKDLYEEWINESFTKCVLKAKNKNHLLKAKDMAEDLGMKEGEDFFLIYDACRTELDPEDFDENGVGRTLTCIGFSPAKSELIDQIGKKYNLL